jgi:hypothetical protein
MGGIYCSSYHGPSFGYYELWTYEPLLGEGKVRSYVGKRGFMIGGNLGDIHPLTGDKIHKSKNSDDLCGQGTLIELEVWHLTFLP